MSYFKIKKYTAFLYIHDHRQLSQAQDVILRFLRHILPVLSPSFLPPTTGKVVPKVVTDLDFFLPFRQHGPSLANARRVIYSKIDHFSKDDGVAFFNVLAFRGVFFGSHFARSAHYRWFDSLQDWELFRAAGKGEASQYGGDDTYYVNKMCYGQPQATRELKLLSSYWNRRLEWNSLFKNSAMPSVEELFDWLMKSAASNENPTKKVKVFRNIGSLTALLICGDLIEAGILPMPSIEDWSGLIHRLGKGAKAGMEMFGLIRKDGSKEEVREAFASLDLALRRKLRTDEKETMGYNIIMLEHTLCKIKRLTAQNVSKDTILSEI